MNSVRLAVASLAVLLARATLAQCSSPAQPNEAWTETYLDQGWNDKANDYYDTTYTLTAPCKVFIDNEFVITATVVDNTYVGVDRAVASKWGITDLADAAGATTVVLDRGYSIETNLGEWVTTVATTYTGTPVNHRIAFRFTPGAGIAMGLDYGVTMISSTTVDPYPDSPPADPPPAVDPTPADPGASGGCSTVGTSGAALALLGLVAALRRRRR